MRSAQNMLAMAPIGAVIVAGYWLGVWVGVW